MCVCVQDCVYECLLLVFICMFSRSVYAGEGLLYAVTVIGHDILQLPEECVDCFSCKGG